MAFGDSIALDLLHAADGRHEPLTLTALEVGDLINDIPSADDVAEAQIAALAEIDVKALRISKKAQQAITAALGLDIIDIWP